MPKNKVSKPNKNDKHIKTEKAMNTSQTSNVNKDEQIGFHKGSLSTLAKEREELLKIIQIVEQLMQMHIKALQDLGIDLAKAAKEAQKNQQNKEVKPKKPIEDLVR